METILIRDARSDDLDFVKNLMQKALEPFYGGDHQAHADRIFRAHINGGDDNIGHFSFSQKMFVITIDEKVAGMIHIVGKRQGTYKISPLIIDADYRGKHGLGGRLLVFIESYVYSLDARQIYCTVAKQNYAAINFFVHHGYVIAGESESHYKNGITEVMMYKLFDREAFSGQFDTSQISVIPMEAKYEAGARKLILEKLPDSFSGVDHSWVDSLFAGYNRRDSQDINQKFKIIYVAVDSGQEVVGIIGATPKKGEPIKAMPLMAKNFQAFVALLIDAPYLLKGYGKKLYTHINPTVSEVIALQRFGWKLNALMPEAYKEGIITQQWGFDFSDDCTRALRVKSSFLKSVKNGKKTLEVRVLYTMIDKIIIGDHIKLFDYDESIIVEVKNRRVYRNFPEMLEHEDSDKIAPGYSKENLLNLLRSFYSAEKEALGIVVFEIVSLT